MRGLIAFARTLRHSFTQDWLARISTAESNPLNACGIGDGEDAQLTPPTLELDQFCSPLRLLQWPNEYVVLVSVRTFCSRRSPVMASAKLATLGGYVHFRSAVRNSLLGCLQSLSPCIT